MKKNYSVAIEMNGQTILKKTFWFLRNADRWALKTIRKILLCNCPATITSNKTGEVLAVIER